MNLSAICELAASAPTAIAIVTILLHCEEVRHYHGGKGLGVTKKGWVIWLTGQQALAIKAEFRRRKFLSFERA